MVASHKKRAFGIFSGRQEAEQALNGLKDSGFPTDKISILARDADKGEQLAGAELTDSIGGKNVTSGTGVVGEIAADSAIGSVLVGLGSLAIPGIGPVIAAGSVATALVATVAGTGIEAVSLNRVVKALTDLGIPEEQARVYSQHLNQGRYLVILEGTEDEISRAEATLSDRGIQDWGVYDSPQT